MWMENWRYIFSEPQRLSCRKQCPQYKFTQDEICYSVLNGLESLGWLKKEPIEWVFRKFSKLPNGIESPRDLLSLLQSESHQLQSNTANATIKILWNHDHMHEQNGCFVSPNPQTRSDHSPSNCACSRNSRSSRHAVFPHHHFPNCGWVQLMRI